ncbi:MAG TPA: VCBS repeat-containing protein [Kofleriaceae bacterium]|nr:VCBS repeat-containing protein [Kofleriaceae bacterium]
MVTIRGDLAIPAELDGVCLAISDRDRTGGEFARFYPDIDSLPQTLTVEPGSASSAEARARGYLGGVEVARSWRTFDFGGGVDVALDLVRCPGGDRGTPEVAGMVATEAGARMGVSVGRGGSLLVVVTVDAVAVYRASGSGLTAVGGAWPVPPALATPRAVVTFDADGDCDDDVLVLYADAAPVLWLRDGVEGLVAADTAFEGAGLQAEVAAAAADVDGDGDLDLVFGRGGVLRLLRNDGAGRFQADGAAIQAGAASDVTALAMGDIDGDGHVDLVVGQGDLAAAPNRVLLNDAAGTGSFEVAAAALPELPLQTRALALGDANGDGFLDLVVGALGTHVRLYVNRGDGRLEDRSFVTLPGVESMDVTSLAMGDWGGDCFADIVIGGGGDPRSWRGSDSGVFANDPIALAEGDQVMLVDVDDDGDRDLVIGGGVLTWVRRQ